MGNSYCTVDEFKNSIYFLGLEDYFSNNDQISGFLLDMSSLIDNYCGRGFATGAFVEDFIGDGRNTFMTKRIPLNSVSSITYRAFENHGHVLNTVYVTNTNTATGEILPGNYTSTREGVIKSNVLFSKGAIFSISYNAGYQDAEIPRPIKTATMMLAKITADSIDVGNLSDPNGAAVNEFQFDKFKEKYVAGNTGNNQVIENLPPTITGILKRYKHLR